MAGENARSMMKEAQRRREDRKPDQSLQGISGSYRFDIDGVGTWRIDVRDGIATITESTAAADCVIRCEEADFVRIAHGQQNLLTAFLQGRVQIDGDYALAQRLHGFIRVTRERAA